MAIEVHELEVIVNWQASNHVGVCSCGWESRAGTIDDVDEAFEAHCDAVFDQRSAEAAERWS
jgi:hypothetical protein